MTFRDSRVRLPVFENGNLRMLGVRDLGPANTEEIYICLPGLLETQKAFDTFATLVAKNHRVITFDYAGRGDSAPLSSREHYKMSSCLTDIATVFSYVIGCEESIAAKGEFSKKNLNKQKPAVHLVGNSMGGLLAVVFAAHCPNVVNSIILNDVAAYLPWSGLLSLLGKIGMNAALNVEGTIRIGPKFLAEDLNVDPRLVMSVLKPTYADLFFEKTSFGLSFEKHFAQIKSPILVVHSEDSQLVDSKVIDLMSTFEQKPTFIAIQGSDHPVFYTKNVVEKILSFSKKSINKKECQETDCI